MKRLRFYTFFLGLLLLVLSMAFVGGGQSTKALSGSEFQAGRIIDDNVFFDGGALDLNSIQGFLNAKVPVCDTWHAAGGGYSPPFTCLKEYMMDVWGTNADQYCSAINYGRYSAAGIIYTVGRACNVSPKVLLVLLQKEQSLVTDTWPWPIQYTAATGYGCPDTSSCDPSFAGLFNQVYYAARQYQRYAKQPEFFNFQRNVTRPVKWHPNSACGTSNVFFENQATAGLYNYTPYRPNSAALNNLYGTGDGCSAYGNRNFWRLYNDWFGNTYGIPFSAYFRGESSEAVTVNQSQKPTVWFDFQNTGAQFWKDDLSALPYYPRTRLMGTWPVNRVSGFADPSWPAPNRPVSVFAKVFENDGVTLTPDQHTVWPGQVARFEFVLNNPTGIPPGSYRENFELVQDGAPNWWVPGGYAWQLVNVPNPFNALFKGVSSAASVTPSQTGTLWFDFQNTGFQFWKDDLSALPYYPRTRLAATWPINRVSAFHDPSWLNDSRPVSVFTTVFESDGVTLASDQHTVWPGQVARFQFTVKYPDGGIAPGTYQENFDIVQDGIPNWWVHGGYAWQAVQVSN